MDLKSGYWQIEVDKRDREKTAFVTPDGLYEFKIDHGSTRRHSVGRAAPLGGQCNGHDTGADGEACRNLFPSHGYRARSAAEGYAEGDRLVQDKVDYKPNDIITVTLYTVGVPFKAFLIKAVDEGEKDVGQFVQLRAHSRLIPNCSAITHTRSEERTNFLARWQAPKDRRGKVHFK
ncbi:hypothetical protein ISCGN_003810 [Ixodes scapularis]